MPLSSQVELATDWCRTLIHLGFKLTISNNLYAIWFEDANKLTLNLWWASCLNPPYRILLCILGLCSIHSQLSLVGGDA